MASADPPAHPSSPQSARPHRVLVDATGRPLQRHICPTCHKSFHWLCYLKRHMLTHDEKNAKDCGGRPGAAGAKRVASGELRYFPPAQLQPVHYSSRSKHVAAGSEIRPYVCDKCAADFASKLKLMRHINSAHGYPAEDSFSHYIFESRPSAPAGFSHSHSLSRPQSCRLKEGRRKSSGAGEGLAPCVPNAEPVQRDSSFESVQSNADSTEDKLRLIEECESTLEVLQVPTVPQSMPCLFSRGL